MTYREKIQALIRLQWKLYDIAGGMRDSATGEEKEAWNTYRGQTYKAAIALTELDDSLSDSRGATPGFKDIKIEA